jgi:hypothetical protein
VGNVDAQHSFLLTNRTVGRSVIGVGGIEIHDKEGGTLTLRNNVNGTTCARDALYGQATTRGGTCTPGALPYYPLHKPKLSK